MACISTIITTVDSGATSIILLRFPNDSFPFLSFPLLSCANANTNTNTNTNANAHVTQSPADRDRGEREGERSGDMKTEIGGRVAELTRLRFGRKKGIYVIPYDFEVQHSLKGFT